MPNLKVVQVIEHFEQVTLGDKGMSLGEMIEEKIRQSLDAGHTLQETTLYFEPDEWHAMQRAHHAGLNHNQAKPQVKAR